MMKQSTCTWDLVGALESGSPASCKTPATFIDSICPNNQPEKQQRIQKRDPIPNKSYCTALADVHRTQG